MVEETTRGVFGSMGKQAQESIFTCTTKRTCCSFLFGLPQSHGIFYQGLHASRECFTSGFRQNIGLGWIFSILWYQWESARERIFSCKILFNFPLSQMLLMITFQRKVLPVKFLQLSREPNRAQVYQHTPEAPCMQRKRGDFPYICSQIDNM